MEHTTSTTYSGAARPAPGASFVTALFHDRDQAEHAYRSLRERGYGTEDVNVMMSDGTRRRLFDEDSRSHVHATDAAMPIVTERGNKAAKGAGVGSAIGGTVGAIAAALVAVGTSLAIPGLGLVVAGPIAAALAGAGAGGATGGLLGALVGAGIPEERVRQYQEGMSRGGILLGVQARSPEDAEAIEHQWQSGGAEHVYR